MRVLKRVVVGSAMAMAFLLATLALVALSTLLGPEQPHSYRSPGQ